MKAKPPGTRSPKTSKAEASLSAGSSVPQRNHLGNQTLVRLLSTGAVSQPGDPQEKEADRIADAVTSPGPHPEAQRIPLPSASSSSTLSGMGPGQPLDPAARAMLEPRFGCDLGAVRVHDGREAAEAAQAVEARAFTVGRDVVFSPGQYAPGTPGGQRLLAHELAHVVQQSATAGSPVIQRSPYNVNLPMGEEENNAASNPLEPVEIPLDEPIGRRNPKIVLFESHFKLALWDSKAGMITVEALWDLGSEDVGPGVRPTEAWTRAEEARSVLVGLGVPKDRIVTSVEKGSPGGLVRISQDATAQPILPPVPSPQISHNLPPPRITTPKLSPPKLASAPPVPGSSGKPPFLTAFGEENTSRDGKAGDIPKAILELPWVKKEIERLTAVPLARGKQAWENLPLVGKVYIPFTALATTAGALAAYHKADPEGFAASLQKLDGINFQFPFPPLPGAKLGFQILNDAGPKNPDLFKLTSPPKGLEKPSGEGFMVNLMFRF